MTYKAQGIEILCCGDVSIMKIRQYKREDQNQILALHNFGLDQFDANAGIGTWDDDLKDIVGNYLNNYGEFLVCDS
jgi:hypothetical protein